MPEVLLISDKQSHFSYGFLANHHTFHRNFWQIVEGIIMIHIIIFILFTISAIGIILYDYKYQYIPLWLIIFNYISICLICNYWLLFGIILIFILYKVNKPIDVIYVLIMLYLIIRIRNTQCNIACIILILLCIFYQKQEKLSFMIPLEMAILIQITTNLI
jgi:hypothetical protein